MSSKIERVIHEGETLALILRARTKLKGIEFFTPKDYPFQFGAQLRERGEIVRPHIHKRIRRTISFTQEMFHIDYGKVRIGFYNEEGKKVTTRVLNSGDTILFVSGGHGMKFLKKTKIIEVKQGPYKAEQDKEFLGCSK
jgi:cupin fold WbuC family metalloprotein